MCTGHTVQSPPDRAPHDVQVDLHVGLSHASGSDEIWGVDARIRKEVRAEGNHPSVSSLPIYDAPDLVRFRSGQAALSILAFRQPKSGGV